MAAHLMAALAILAGSSHTAGAQDFDFLENEEGLVVMEAENFSDNLPNGTAEWLFTAEPLEYSGDGAMLAVSDGPFADAATALEGSPVMIYTVKFNYPGPHYIWVRASRSIDDPGGTDSYHTGLNQAIPESGTWIQFEGAFGGETGTWQWIWKCETIAGQAYVDIPSEGVYDFEIYIREEGFRIDKIVLSQVPYEDGMGFGPPADTIEETRNTTGIGLNDLKEGAFTFFPNPAGEWIQVRLDPGAVSAGRIGINDLTGKLVRTERTGAAPSFRMDVGELPAGVYYLKLERGTRTLSVQKMLKL
jgi:hypothetical protein